MKPQLGNRVRDRITGVEGVVIADCQWIYGCRRLTIQPQSLKDGRPVDNVTFDADQLEVLEASTPESFMVAKEALTGGPTPDTAQAETPAR